jgi:hypothetical protein
VVTVTGPLILSFGNTKILPQGLDDLLFAGTSVVAIASFGPGPIVVDGGVGTTPSLVVPSAPVLRLARPAPTGGATVTFTPSAGLPVSAPNVVFAAGEQERTVALSITDVPSGTPRLSGTLTASVGASTLAMPVQAWDVNQSISIATISPAILVMNEAATVPVTITFSEANSSGGPIPVRFSASDPTVADTTTESVLWLPGATTVQFDVASIAAGVSVISIETPWQSGISAESIGVQVRPPAPQPCLRFSEYVEGTSENKAIEVWNCGSVPVDLTGVNVDLQANADTTFSATYPMSGTLGPNDVFVICRNSTLISAELSPRCDASSNVAAFNGDDRLALYREENTTLRYQAGADTLLDAFGELGVRPAGTPWINIGYRRCVLRAAHLGGPFDVATYFSAIGVDDFSGLGLVPADDCP